MRPTELQMPLAAVQGSCGCEQIFRKGAGPGRAREFDMCGHARGWLRLTLMVGIRLRCLVPSTC